MGRSARGILFALIGAACWGFSATCASYLMGSFGLGVPWLVSARLFIAGPMFLLLSWFTAKDKLKEIFHDGKMLLHVAANALVGVLSIQFAYMFAVRYAGAGNALLLQETGLIIIMALACFKGRRLPSGRELLALVLALAGTAAIATQGNVGSLGINPLGLLWGLLAGLALAGYNIVPVKLLDKYGSFITNGMSMSLAAIVLLPIVQPWHVPVVMPVEGWMAFAAIVVFGTFVAYLLYMQGVKDAGPVNASLIAVFEPISGMFFSLLWLGDAITLFDAIGCVLIVGMMILVSLPAKEN